MQERRGRAGCDAEEGLADSRPIPPGRLIGCLVDAILPHPRAGIVAGLYFHPGLVEHPRGVHDVRNLRRLPGLADLTFQVVQGRAPPRQRNCSVRRLQVSQEVVPAVEPGLQVLRHGQYDIQVPAVPRFAR